MPLITGRWRSESGRVDVSPVRARLTIWKTTARTIAWQPTNQFYRDRQGRVEDPFGVQWALGQQIEKLTDEEVSQRAEDWIAGNS